MAAGNKLPIKTYYIWIILLTLVGAITSILLIPSSATLAHVNTQAQRFKDASSYYDHEYKKGVRSPDLLYRLSQLELKKGNTAEAIKYAEELVNTYPENLSALQYIQNLYLSNLDFEKYYSTLKKIEPLQRPGTPANVVTLQRLAKWYGAENQPGQQAEVLQHILKSQRATYRNYKDLAFYFASKKDYEKSEQLMEESSARFPHDVMLDDLFFIIWLKFKTPEAKENPKIAAAQSVETLSHFLEEKNQPKLTSSALNYVTTNYPQWAPLFIRKIYHLTEERPSLEFEAIDDLMLTSKDQNDKNFAFFRLVNFYSRHPDTPQVQRLYFNSLHERNYTALLSYYIRKGKLQDLKKDDVRNFAEWAAFKRRRELSREMLNSMPCQHWEQNRVSHVVILATADACEAEALFDKLLREDLSHRDLYLLFIVALDKGWISQALGIGCRLKFNELSADELAQVASVFITNGKADKFERKLNLTRPQMGSDKTGAAIALLNANRGYSARAAEWLCRQKHVWPMLLDDLYTIAESRKEDALALYVAKRLKNEYPSPVSEAYYARSLVRVGKVGDGMNLLEPIYCKNRNNNEIEEAYFSALAEATKACPSYGLKLSTFIYKQLKEQPCVPAPRLRDFAYAYLEGIKDKERAEQLFLTLVGKGCANKEDVEMLLDLWGPCVTQMQANFIIQGARKAQFADLLFWLNSLNSIGKYGEVIQIVREKMQTSNCWLGVDVYFAYLDALYDCKLYDEMRVTIRHILPNINEKDKLEVLANFAGAIDDYTGRGMVWQKAAYLYPNDMVVWQALADAAFTLQDDCLTMSALCRFFALYRASGKENKYLYVSVYELGVILEKQYRFAKARACYRCVLSIIAAQKKTFETVLYEALALQQLNAPAAALSKMSEFYELTSRDPQAAADFAQMMMDLGAWNSARKLIGSTIGYRCN